MSFLSAWRRENSSSDVAWDITVREGWAGAGASRHALGSSRATEAPVTAHDILSVSGARTPEEFLRIARIGATEGYVALGRDVDSQYRAGLRHDDAARCLVGPLQGYVWVLRRGAAAYDEGERQKSEFHGFEFFNR